MPETLRAQLATLEREDASEQDVHDACTGGAAMVDTMQAASSPDVLDSLEEAGATLPHRTAKVRRALRYGVWWDTLLELLNEIGDASQVPKYLEKAKDKNDPFRLMGFGHRVYKNFDPRATVIRGYCHEVLEHYGMQNDRLFELALELERIALEDDYFVERKLYPNVDFYSGIIYQALGIPINMFTPMFAIARTVGWAAHWSEMMADPGMRIARPRQVYTGYKLRDYVNIDKR